MKNIALLAIRCYQRYVSPYKGFACAYRVHSGRASCSALGYRAIRRYGLQTGLGILRCRLYRCGIAHQWYRTAPRPLNRQAGVCDLVPCHLPLEAACHPPSLDCGADFLSQVACSVCDAPCHFADWRAFGEGSKDDMNVHIPSRERRPDPPRRKSHERDPAALRPLQTALPNHARPKGPQD